MSPPTMTIVEPEAATPARGTLAPDACCVHVAPSGEVKVGPGFPGPPTATNSVPVQVTAIGKAPPLDTCVVHVAPSGEVMIRSVQHEPTFAPTTTNCDPDHVTPFRLLAPKVCGVHTVPSDDVKSLLFDAATNVLPDEAKALMELQQELPVRMLCCVQVMPSGT